MSAIVRVTVIMTVSVTVSAQFYRGLVAHAALKSSDVVFTNHVKLHKRDVSFMNESLSINRN